MQYIHYILRQFPAWSGESAPIHIHTILTRLSVASQDISFLCEQQRKSTVLSIFDNCLKMHYFISVCNIKNTLLMVNALHGLKRKNSTLNTSIYLWMFCWKLQISAMLKIWSNTHWNQWICCHFHIDSRTGSCIGALHSSRLKFSISADAWSFLCYFCLPRGAIAGLKYLCSFYYGKQNFTLKKSCSGSVPSHQFTIILPFSHERKFSPASPWQNTSYGNCSHLLFSLTHLWKWST